MININNFHLKTKRSVQRTLEQAKRLSSSSNNTLHPLHNLLLKIMKGIFMRTVMISSLNPLHNPLLKRIFTRTVMTSSLHLLHNSLLKIMFTRTVMISSLNPLHNPLLKKKTLEKDIYENCDDTIIKSAP